MRAFTRWMSALPYTDPTTYRQASLLQAMLFGVTILSFLGSFITLLAPVPQMVAWIVIGIIWTSVLIEAAGIALVRRGRFDLALAFGCIGLLLVTGALLLTTGVRSSSALLFAFALPIVLAGLMGSRRLVIVTVASLAVLLSQ
ncbi:MAG: hypothetical protein NZ699_03885 [Roseiflexus sp.]|nr:hypothetical protein [Roseiflexus sp.]MCS7288254.1 hypothetical protein [Roseiflexus sp.]MDW8145888.1 hypothetical protein [Roseiflexaceae bacterium]MDW8232085.1 hypothetical protein [Roseiflexaceae bacterium]